MPRKTASTFRQTQSAFYCHSMDGAAIHQVITTLILSKKHLNIGERQ